jgi:hypothetical protein
MGRREGRNVAGTTIRRGAWFVVALIAGLATAASGSPPATAARSVPAHPATAIHSVEPGAAGSGVLAAPKVTITSFELRDIDNQYLSFLSASGSNPYYGGNTRIRGSIVIRCPAGDALTSVKLQVRQNHRAVASASLDRAAARLLLVPCGSRGRIAIAKSRLLFLLPKAEAARVHASKDMTVGLRVVVKTRRGRSAYRDWNPVILLTRYTGTNRYGQRDGTVCLDLDGKPTTYQCGGDDWVLPSVRPVLAHYTGISWNDISNMNGGVFPYHMNHAAGFDADGWFPGYNARDAATARTIIGQLNDAAYGSRIEHVYATFSYFGAFWDVIKDVTLDDGRRASDVIASVPGHETHFHWVVTYAGPS